MALASGTAIRVEDAAGSVTLGRLVTVQDDHLALSAGGSERSVLRSDVGRVLIVRRLVAAGARRGFLIGAAGGALQGALLTKNRAVFASLFGAAWGFEGALGGSCFRALV
jgi:hypothetical protein